MSWVLLRRIDTLQRAASASFHSLLSSLWCSSSVEPSHWSIVWCSSCAVPSPIASSEWSLGSCSVLALLRVVERVSLSLPSCSVAVVPFLAASLPAPSSSADPPVGSRDLWHLPTRKRRQQDSCLSRKTAVDRLNRSRYPNRWWIPLKHEI